MIDQANEDMEVFELDCSIMILLEYFPELKYFFLEFGLVLEERYWLIIIGVIRREDSIYEPKR